MAMIIGVVRAEGSEESEELVDPQTQLREKCSKSHECPAYEAKLQECNDRVNSRTKTAETCVEELIDFMHCVEHCVAKDLFKYLK